MKLFLISMLVGILLAACGGSFAPPAKQTVFAALGDSETAGYVPPSAAGAPFILDQTRSYPANLAIITGFNVRNFGIGGRDITQILAEEYPTALALRPDKVAIMSGINDALHGIPMDLFKSDYLTMIRGFQNQGATVYLMTPLRWMTDNDQIILYAQAVRDMGHQTGCRVIDLAAIQKATWFPATYDGHPSYEAYQEIAQIVAGVVA